MKTFSESVVEEAALAWLGALGYSIASARWNLRDSLRNLMNLVAADDPHSAAAAPQTSSKAPGLPAHLRDVHK